MPDPPYLTCPRRADGHHTLAYQPDVNGIVVCTACRWRARPAWIAQCMVTIRRAVPHPDEECHSAAPKTPRIL